MMWVPSDGQVAGRVKTETHLGYSDPGGLSGGGASSAEPRGGTGCGQMARRMEGIRAEEGGTGKCGGGVKPIH